MDSNGAKRLSVCITAYNAHKCTQVHVREAMNSTRVPDEIIVVNDHGTPDLKEMLESLDRKCRLIYAYITEDIPWNYTGARNLGYWLSRGDILSMEDNDHIPSRNVYEEAMKFMAEHPNIGRLLSGKRPRLSEADLDKPYEEWQTKDVRPKHQDTQFLRREVYMKVKGCDERFAGAYGWACADWRRRLLRANIPWDNISSYFYIVTDSPTELIRRKSYRNYEYAREKDGHTQSPIGNLNFHYDLTIYDE